MKVLFTDQAIKQLNKLEKSDKKYLTKIYQLITDIEKHPYSGLGKPEQLKYFSDNRWSRRIDKANRLVYLVAEPDVIIISVVGHY